MTIWSLFKNGLGPLKTKSPPITSPTHPSPWNPFLIMSWGFLNPNPLLKVTKLSCVRYHMVLSRSVNEALLGRGVWRTLWATAPSTAPASSPAAAWGRPAAETRPGRLGGRPRRRSGGSVWGTPTDYGLLELKRKNNYLKLTNVLANNIPYNGYLFNEWLQSSFWPFFLANDFLVGVLEEGTVHVPVLW